MSHDRHSELGIHPLAEGEPQQRQQMMRRARLVLVVVLVLLAAGAARTVISRAANARALEAGTAERAKVFVRVAPARSSADGQTLALPGTLQGFVQAPISARSGGYLKRWYKDIGAEVKKGDLLAELDTPEIDQQLSQALAARQQAASSMELARSSMARWEALRKKDAVSQQELDERRSAFAQASSNLAAADANVERLRQVEGFKRIVAPFSGIITRRNVDVGDLIDPGAGRSLFVLSQTDPLRVYVNVPQSYANLVKPGQQVTVSQAELRGRKFEGKVARTAGSIDPVTRSMQIEVTLPNADNALLPGAFVQVALPLKPSGTLLVAADTLMFRRDGSLVAAVDEHNRVRLKKVRLGRNFGLTVEVLEGLNGNEKLILNPSDSLAEGDQVEPTLEQPEQKQKAAS
ncbi:RND transporter MFP subunit [Herbaspirillum rubrisubalbicans]|uniref:RND transporter MFP subunit n=1 Tax=Herbaspirillum rubrisubalbicans TaxID=80842 RepID=A0ABX9C0I1_9BURK|nr:efflux RND transporter periplasmic adaptor subunit [Herbaspirillum rubrisubalbicans]MCP1575111.1 RND family efflux transporter MFP subunit [Herbaspirillum rubrisubalbicans]RAM63812.1 RND transporter MFP subunit [Herbaspirillum rubrisubalbicans]RAN44725.1 RND transporter MFP subunit [Herbaspirillum rubrisubalbicans]